MFYKNKIFFVIILIALLVSTIGIFTGCTDSESEILIEDGVYTIDVITYKGKEYTADDYKKAGYYLNNLDIEVKNNNLILPSENRTIPITFKKESSDGQYLIYKDSIDRIRYFSNSDIIAFENNYDTTQEIQFIYVRS